MADVTIAYLIAGTVANEQASGHRVSVTLRRGGGGVVIVYNPAGKRTRTLLYRRLERAEITHQEASDG